MKNLVPLSTAKFHPGVPMRPSAIDGKTGPRASAELLNSNLLAAALGEDQERAPSNTLKAPVIPTLSLTSALRLSASSSPIASGGPNAPPKAHNRFLLHDCVRAATSGGLFVPIRALSID
jgi:hypothetical protein